MSTSICSNRWECQWNRAFETTRQIPGLPKSCNTLDDLWNWGCGVQYPWTKCPITRLKAYHSLNLTQASRIHIVEPQWNPTIEAQAIGRALRLGQTQQVTVMRYIMENTVEQVVFSGRTIYHCQALTAV